jgi:hypothetical protein
VADTGLWGRVKKTHVLVGITCLALLLPQLRTEARGWGGQHWGRPILFGVGTDEEAYLVLLNSVLRDGDLDLQNNYRNAERGSHEAGLKGAGHRLFHHSSYYLHGERKIFSELQAMGIDPRTLGPEYSAHCVGVGLLLAPLLWPFRSDPDWVESAALIATALAVVLGLFFWLRLAQLFGLAEPALSVALVGVFLGTPIWFYTRAFYNEAYLLPLVCGAYLMVFLAKPRPLAAGMLLAAGMMMKPQMALLVPILCWPFLRERAWGKVAKLAGPAGAALAALLVLNQRMYGSPFRGPYPFLYGNFFQGAYQLIASPDRGLLWYAPAVAVGSVGWIWLWRERRLQSAMVLAGVATQFGVVAAWADPGGGWCYAGRLLVPILPLLGLGLGRAWEVAGLGWRWLLGGVLASGVAYNALAVMRYWVTMTSLGTPFRLLEMTLAGS